MWIGQTNDGSSCLISFFFFFFFVLCCFCFSLTDFPPLFCFFTWPPAAAVRRKVAATETKHPLTPSSLTGEIDLRPAQCSLPQTNTSYLTLPFLCICWYVPTLAVAFAVEEEKPLKHLNIEFVYTAPVQADCNIRYPCSRLSRMCFFR